MKASVVEDPFEPTTLNLRFNNVPAPVKNCAWNAEIIRCPALFAFGVIDIALLSVPA